jgi:hypothetical protein
MTGARNEVMRLTDETLKQLSIDAVIVRCARGCEIGHVWDTGAPEGLGWWVPESKDSNRARYRAERGEGNMTGGDGPPLPAHFLDAPYLRPGRCVIGQCRDHGSTDIPARDLIDMYEQAVKDGRRRTFRVPRR